MIRESSVMRDVEIAFAHRGFWVLPRSGWRAPIGVDKAYKGVLWRNNTGGMKSADSRRFVRFGIKGRADYEGFCDGGRMIAVEVKRSEGTALDEMQECWGQWYKAYGVMWMKAWSYESTIKALSEYGY